MKKTTYIYDLRSSRLPPMIGSKAKNLRRLMEKGFQVPSAYVCTWDPYVRYCDGDTAVMQDIREELGRKINTTTAYAVRSSANIEDSLDHSFAGQFRTILNARGADAVAQAIQEVWAGTHSASMDPYLQKAHGTAPDLKMAVIIQDMITPTVSGVAFSRNPITSLDEIVIEAVTGSGVALVQDGVTPLRWVNKWGKWLARPQQEIIEAHVLQQLVDETRQISRALKSDVDLEWVYDGRTLHWLQVRDITSIRDLPVYSNTISKEMLPGIIKPLIWSVNTALVNGAWVKLITEMIGRNDIEPAGLTRAFYYRAYFNMGVFGRIFDRLGMPRRSLEMMMGLRAAGAERERVRMSPRMMALLPRMLPFLSDKLRFAGRIEQALSKIKAESLVFATAPTTEVSESEILAAIDSLFSLSQRLAYYNIVGPLLMFAYNGILKSQLTKIGVDFERFDLIGDMDELKDLDPNTHLRRLNAQFRQLDQGTQQQILACSYEQFARLPGVTGLRQEVASFIERFGHLSDSGNDFSSEPWRENPDMILRLVTSYREYGDTTSDKVAMNDLRVSGVRRMMVRWLYRQARAFRLYRERIGSLYTYVYGLFRVWYLALADRFVQRGLLAEPGDVFYLYSDEVREIVTGRPVQDYAALVAQRKDEIERCRVVELPETIYGDQSPPIIVSSSERLSGTPTSRGYYTGRVKVVRGIQDFGKLEQGDVLVVPYSDVGWTPLFAKAGAVVAESGGMLSHSSIIAREYNIPAVVSVDGATHLRDNTLVTVDGYKGEVTIHKEP